MIQKLKQLWQSKIVKNFLWVLIILAIFFGIRPFFQGNVAEGTPPSVEGMSINDKPISLAQFKNQQPVMVHFWATWCPICRFEIDNIESISKDHAVINIATQSGDNQALLDFAKENQMNSDQILNDYDGSLLKLYGAKAVPATFFVNGKGEISTVEVGYTTFIGMSLRMWWLNTFK